MMNILITGGTGFIGRSLIAEFLRDPNNQLIIFTRRNLVNQRQIKYIKNFNQININIKFEVIINLAGADISRRWSENYKKELLNSRLKITKELIDFVISLKTRPKLLITASAIGYYGAGNFDYLEEETVHNHQEIKKKIISDFTHDLCWQWENQATKMEVLNVRVCVARFGIVLGRNGGALQKMAPLFKLAMGGKIGTGKQFFSWIHIKDVVQIIQYCIKHEAMQGAFNFTAPNPVTNAQFTEILAKILQRPAYLNLPAALIKIIFGEMGEKLLLRGNAVYPSRLIKKKYKFLFPELEPALRDILQKY